MFFPLKDHLLLMTFLKLGRMKRGRCIQNQAALGCYDDVTNYMKQTCYGEQVCSVNVGTLGHLITDCPTNVMSYLYIEHQCVIGLYHCIKYY